jgi:hypothetical protein
MPELCGSTTDSAAATAIAASNALPPCAITSKPASVASLCALAIAALPVSASNRPHRQTPAPPTPATQ